MKNSYCDFAHDLRLISVSSPDSAALSSFYERANCKGENLRKIWHRAALQRILFTKLSYYL